MASSNHSSIAPSDHFEIHTEFQISSESFELLAKGDLRLWLIFEYIFEDVFEKRYHRAMTLLSTPEWELMLVHEADEREVK